MRVWSDRAGLTIRTDFRDAGMTRANVAERFGLRVLAEMVERGSWRTRAGQNHLALFLFTMSSINFYI